jgi:hypothetical protein
MSGDNILKVDKDKYWKKSKKLASFNMALYDIKKVNNDKNRTTKEKQEDINEILDRVIS